MLSRRVHLALAALGLLLGAPAALRLQVSRPLPREMWVELPPGLRCEARPVGVGDDPSLLQLQPLGLPAPIDWHRVEPFLFRGGTGGMRCTAIDRHVDFTVPISAFRVPVGIAHQMWYFPDLWFRVRANYRLTGRSERGDGGERWEVVPHRDTGGLPW